MPTTTVSQIQNTFRTAEKNEVAGKAMIEHHDSSSAIKYLELSADSYYWLLKSLNGPNDFVVDENNKTVRSSDGKIINAEHLNEKLTGLCRLLGDAYDSVANRLSVEKDQYKIFISKANAGIYLIKAGDTNSGTERLRVACQYGLSAVIKTLEANKFSEHGQDASAKDILESVLKYNSQNPVVKNRDEITKRAEEILNHRIMMNNAENAAIWDFMKSNSLSAAKANLSNTLRKEEGKLIRASEDSGQVLAVSIASGGILQNGDLICITTECEIITHRDGIVKSLMFETGDMIRKGDMLVELY